MKIKESQLRKIIRESLQELNETNNVNIVGQINYMSERLQRLSQELQYCGNMVDNILKRTISNVSNIFNTKIDVIDVEPEQYTLKFTINLTPEQIANKVITDEYLMQRLTGEFGDYEGMNPQQVKQEIMNNPSDAFDNILYDYRDNVGRGYSVDFEYYQKPVISIDTPINFEEFNCINNIMDF